MNRTRREREREEVRLAMRGDSLSLFAYSDQVQQQQIFTPITFQSTIINCSFQLLFFLRSTCLRSFEMEN